jgi:hypothetical protein
MVCQQIRGGARRVCLHAPNRAPPRELLTGGLGAELIGRGAARDTLGRVHAECDTGIEDRLEIGASVG